MYAAKKRKPSKKYGGHCLHKIKFIKKNLLVILADMIEAECGLEDRLYEVEDRLQMLETPKKNKPAKKTNKKGAK